MIFLAIRHLLARKKQSLVTLLGVFIGTTAFIVISGFFMGFQNYLTESLVSGDAHIKIQARQRLIEQPEMEKVLFPEYKEFKWIRPPAGRRSAASIDNPAGWFERFADTPEVIASTPVYNTTGLINSNSIAYTISVTGMRPSEQIKVTNIEEKMIKGSLLDLDKGVGGIIIGKELASDLAKQVGDSLILTSVDGRTIAYRVTGIFETGNTMTDRSSAYMLLVDAQKLANQAGRISQISVKVKDFKKASALADIWKATSFDRVESWDQSNSGLLSIFRSQEILQYTVTSVILLVAGFGIYNILNMVVNQKRKDIAILRSMGFEADDIITLFLLQGLALGLAGGLIGCLCGYIICIELGSIKMGGPSSGTFTIDFDLVTYLKALALSNGVALVASVLPARSASKLTPIEIIRAGAE